MRGLITVCAVTVGQVAVADSAQADVALLVCDSATGDIDVNPPFTLLPTTVNIEGTASSDSCDGVGAAADITGATTEVTGTIVGALCVPLLNTFVGTLNAGSLHVIWEGGSSPGTSTFSWTIPASIQIGPSTSVLALVGYSVAGRFHIPAAPAEVLMILTLGNPTPACPGTNSVEVIDATVALLDVA